LGWLISITGLLLIADVAAPLNALQKKDRLVWGQEQQEAFKALKRAISQPLVLGMANFF
jgi:hypothetical protein